MDEPNQEVAEALYALLKKHMAGTTAPGSVLREDVRASLIVRPSVGNQGCLWASTGPDAV